MSTLVEAAVVTESCVRAGLRGWASFVCQDGGQLLSGEPVRDAARAVAGAGAEAVLVNCVPTGHLDTLLAELAAHSPVPIGAYPNLEDRSAIPDWTTVNRYVPATCGPEEFAAPLAERARRYGLSIVGCCCCCGGASPAHLAALRARLTG